MPIQAFTKRERSQILQEFNRATNAYHQAMNAGELETAQQEKKLMQAAKEAYYRRLPRLVMSCCPFDERPLIRTFDPYGLDGLWWRSASGTDEPPACPHFCVMLGAVNFDDKKPRAGAQEVRPGPEIPFVIPRLLEFPGMVAVVSEIEMASGYTAYPIAYFAERRPKPEDLTAGWARTDFTFTTQLGVSGWRTPHEVWDFNLLPWLQQKKLRWCLPDSGNTELSEAPPETCPYLDIKGRRQPIVVQDDLSWVEDLPAVI